MAEPRFTDEQIDAAVNNTDTLGGEFINIIEQLRRERDEARDCCQTSTEVALNEAQQRLESEIERDALRELLRECAHEIRVYTRGPRTSHRSPDGYRLNTLLARIEEVMPNAVRPAPAEEARERPKHVVAGGASVQHAQEREARHAAEPRAKAGTENEVSASAPSDADRQRAKDTLNGGLGLYPDFVALPQGLEGEYADDILNLALEFAAVRAEGFRAGLEAAAQECDSAAYVEECADDTMAGVRRGEPWLKAAARIRALADRQS